MFLVSVHAEVSSTARNLLDRTLHALIGDVVDEALACFRQITRFGMGGMLGVGHLFPYSLMSRGLRHMSTGNTGNRIYASDGRPLCQ